MCPRYERKARSACLTGPQARNVVVGTPQRCQAPSWWPNSSRAIIGLGVRKQCHVTKENRDIGKLRRLFVPAFVTPPTFNARDEFWS